MILDYITLKAIRNWNFVAVNISSIPKYIYKNFSSVQFSHSVVSDSLWRQELQHARPPCPSLTPGVYPNSCPSSRWCHLAISSSVVPFSFCPQSHPASESFPVSQLFASGGQSIGVSASASVLPMNIQCWFPLGLTSLISLLPKRLWSVFSSTTFWNHQFFGAQPSLWSNFHIHTWLLEKPSVQFSRTQLSNWSITMVALPLVIQSWLLYTEILLWLPKRNQVSTKWWIANVLPTAEGWPLPHYCFPNIEQWHGNPLQYSCLESPMCGGVW